MDVLFLGAGRPAKGEKPAALKKVALNTTAMDWQLRSLGSFKEQCTLHYLGGYHVEDVFRRYPELNFTIVADWEQRNVVHTLFKAPLAGSAALITYSDTVFREDVINTLVATSADVSFGIDSGWRSRYEHRTDQDIQIAETIDLANFDPQLAHKAEFTGLIYLSQRVAKTIVGKKESDVGSNLIDFLYYLDKEGFTLEPIDVRNQWAEFNESADIARFILGTKAETLARLEPHVKLSTIGEQVSFTTTAYASDRETELRKIAKSFPDLRVIVRSSSKAEDNWRESNAGGFRSILNVDGGSKKELHDAIQSVINSYGEDVSDEDQILVQKQINEVKLSGVVFTCGLETGAPYYCFNFDDRSNSTESVTDGSGQSLRTVILAKNQSQAVKSVVPELSPVQVAVSELEELLGFDKLDIEFAMDAKGNVHIFQVRPITVDHSNYEVDDGTVEVSRSVDKSYFATRRASGPMTYGKSSVFSNMSDWNPAEIVGARPKPLALSLYQELITNDIWAMQRFEFGYGDVRPCPLIASFSGQPYVDVRASINSFIPGRLSDDIAERLAQAYLDLLADNPHYHDKLEFEVVFTIWTPGFHSRAMERLRTYGVSSNDISQLEEHLINITRNALGRLENDIDSISKLTNRRDPIQNSGVSSVEKAFALLDDCKRFGTLAFAHAARAGFVASAFLRDFEDLGILTRSRVESFMSSIETVAGEQRRDLLATKNGIMSTDELVRRYGHLRPGTYEITAKAYWEDPQRYLPTSGIEQTNAALPKFELTERESAEITEAIEPLDSKRDADFLLNYLRNAIEQRERVKFEFTKSLSLALDECTHAAIELGLSREDASFIEFSEVKALRLNALSLESLKNGISQRRERYKVTEVARLPALIVNEIDFDCFELSPMKPNFITSAQIDGEVAYWENREDLGVEDKIVVIPQADPGYDWLFSRGIAGLITQYGGANSHMAIRAAEMRLPAAIGVGKTLYEKIRSMRLVRLDCKNQVIQEIG